VPIIFSLMCTRLHVKAYDPTTNKMTLTPSLLVPWCIELIVVQTLVTVVLPKWCFSAEYPPRFHKGFRLWTLQFSPAAGDQDTLSGLTFEDLSKPHYLSLSLSQPKSHFGVSIPYVNI